MPSKHYRYDGTKWRGSAGLPDIDIIDPFVLGSVKPTAVNTGLITPTTDTITAADTTFSTPGQVITNTRINGNINLAAANIRFENCDIRGKLTTTANHIARANNAAQTGAYFYRCKIQNDFHPSTDGADGAHGGVMGKSMTLERCDISGGTDGIGIVGSSVSVLGCYIHGLWFFSPNSDHPSDGNHCDAIQCHMGVSNVNIYGSTLEGLLDDTLEHSQAGIPPTYSGGTLVSGNSWYYDYPDWQGYDYPPWGTSTILFGYASPFSLTNINIEKNWIDGGGYACININSNWTNANTSNIVIKDNRVGAHNRDGYLVICNSGLSMTLTGNVNEVDGTANNSRRNG